MDPLIIPFVPRRTKDHTHSNHAQKTLRFPMPKQKGARRKIINDMAKRLKGQIRSMPVNAYQQSKGFLKSLMFTACNAQLG